MRFVGRPKKVYATADFSIRGNTATNGRLELLQDATFDTQGHTVTMTSSIFGDGKLTKTGEGSLVLACGGANALTKAILVAQGALAVSNGISLFSGVDLKQGSTLAVDVSPDRDFAVESLAAEASAKIKILGDLSECEILDSIVIANNCDQETFKKLTLEKDVNLKYPEGTVPCLKIENGKLILKIVKNAFYLRVA